MDGPNMNCLGIAGTMRIAVLGGAPRRSLLGNALQHRPEPIGGWRKELRNMSIQQLLTRLPEEGVVERCRIAMVAPWKLDRNALRRRLVWRGEASPDRKAAALCSSLDRWWAALWTFARVEGVEPTNNVAERALRPAVLWRKGSFGSDSEAGSRFAERMLSVVATCHQQGRRLLDLLVAAGEAAVQGAAAPSLLPRSQGG
jgi:Transposase IS66 family